MKITANGISINYTLEGPASAPVVTLSHSLATNLSMWDLQIPMLTSRYRVLRYDTRGHGGTDAPGDAYTLDQLAEDARAPLQALGMARWATFTRRFASEQGRGSSFILGAEALEALGLVVDPKRKRLSPSRPHAVRLGGYR